MKRTLSVECKEKTGKSVLVKGWMNELRELGKINFLILRDRGGYIQVVIEDKSEMKKLKDMQVGTVLAVEARVKEAKQTKLGVELANPEITVLSPVTEVPPVEYSKDDINAALPTILDNRAITVRNKKIQAVFRVQATILRGFRESMREQGFIEFRSPVLMGTPSESGATVFEVKYYDRKAYLAQSPQFYKQIMVGAFERAFTVTPVFRAEKHHTSRHLTELTQLDGEMAFVSDMSDVHEVCENMLRYVFELINKENRAELDLWKCTTPKLPRGEFPVIKVREAHKIIEDRTGKKAGGRKLDMEPEDEREISKWALKEHESDILWVTHYLQDKNPYTWNTEKGDESLSFDLVCRGIEWLTGTMRVHDYKKLVENMKREKFNLENYKGYLQAFKYGMPPEAGFSFGLERITQKIFNLENVRKATLFPRDVDRMTP